MDPAPSPVQRPGRAARRLIGPFTVGHVLALSVSLLVTAVLLIALTSPRRRHPAMRAPRCPGPASIESERRAPGSPSATDRRRSPATAPAIVDLDGVVVDLAGLEGRPVWVVFWATWCPPCQQETPDLQRAWEANRDTGLEP